MGDSGQKLEWNQQGEYFVFDDSYVHAVNYPGQPLGSNSTDGRIVLIVDLWNPSLTSMEREAIRHLYPPG